MASSFASGYCLTWDYVRKDRVFVWIQIISRIILVPFCYLSLQTPLWIRFLHSTWKDFVSFVISLTKKTKAESCSPCILFFFFIHIIKDYFWIIPTQRQDFASLGQKISNCLKSFLTKQRENGSRQAVTGGELQSIWNNRCRRIIRLLKGEKIA